MSKGHESPGRHEPLPPASPYNIHTESISAANTSFPSDEHASALGEPSSNSQAVMSFEAAESYKPTLDMKHKWFEPRPANNVTPLRDAARPHAVPFPWMMWLLSCTTNGVGAEASTAMIEFVVADVSTVKNTLSPPAETVISSTASTPKSTTDMDFGSRGLVPISKISNKVFEATKSKFSAIDTATWEGSPCRTTVSPIKSGLLDSVTSTTKSSFASESTI